MSREEDDVGVAPYEALRHRAADRAMAEAIVGMNGVRGRSREDWQSPGGRQHCCNDEQDTKRPKRTAETTNLPSHVPPL